MDENDQTAIETFDQLHLVPPLLQAVDDAGFEAPTPIQLQTIPPLLDGLDVIGQAQTGTGKTAAFALPMLQALDVTLRQPQALILTPTRELALQVAEAIHLLGRHLDEVRVLPVYGGQPISRQISRLDKGVHIVVGTPGRIMDHLRRDTLDFAALRMIVLDEADEMLRMGFIEDVEWILDQAPRGLQTALFSATIPDEIREVADHYLYEPVTVRIEPKALTVPTVDQRYINVSEKQKLNALTNILETQLDPGEAVLTFTRTRVGAAGLADQLQARGFAAEAMHGEMAQAQREQVLRRLRAGQTEIVVATDVAARGLDVEHISTVVNYDIPYDVESYVHRIGRTARAGRSGKAILFVTPAQRQMQHNIEWFIGQKIEPMQVPSKADVASRRIALFKQQLIKTLEEEDLDLYLNLVEELAEESGSDMAEIAAAAARLAREDRPLVAPVEPAPELVGHPEQGMVRLFVDAGRRSGVRPGDIVGAIANEADVPGKAIGAIDIYDRFTFVEVPAQYKDQVLERMANSMIRHREAKIRVARPPEEKPPAGPARPGKPKRRRPRSGDSSGKSYSKGKGKGRRKYRKL